MGPWCLGPKLIPAPRVAGVSGEGEKALCGGDAEVACALTSFGLECPGGLVTAGACRGAAEAPNSGLDTVPAQLPPRRGTWVVPGFARLESYLVNAM